MTVGAQRKECRTDDGWGGYHDASEGADLNGGEAALRQRDALLAREWEPLAAPLLFKSTQTCQDERIDRKACGLLAVVPISFRCTVGSWRSTQKSASPW